MQRKNTSLGQPAYVTRDVVPRFEGRSAQPPLTRLLAAGPRPRSRAVKAMLPTPTKPRLTGNSPVPISPANWIPGASFDSCDLMNTPSTEVATERAKPWWLLDVAWIVVCGVLSSIGCVTTASQIGATFDEPFYLESGLEHWRTGSSGSLLRKGTMPLPVDVETLPVRIWEIARGNNFTSEELHTYLPVARAGNLAFWWILLVYGFLIAKKLAGPWAGRFAVAWLACEPSLLAHASLATTDVAITACLVAFVYHFRMGREKGWWLRIAIPALWFGLAILTKVSGMVFGPICMLAIEIERLVRSGELRLPSVDSGMMGKVSVAWRRLWVSLAPLRRDGLQIGILGFVLVYVYCGTDWQPEPSFVEWAHSLPAGQLHDSMVWTSEHLCIFSNAGEAIFRQVKHGIRGHDVFVLGESHRRSIWYYFPVALSMKMAIPVLLLPVVLLVLRRRALSNWILWAAFALLLFSLNCKVQIGIRLVLPLVALLLVGLAAALVQAVRDSPQLWQKRILVASALGSVLWTAQSAYTVWPNSLCYINEMWGGTDQGYYRLSDSNYDWGQGLKELAQWQEEQGVPELGVWYFGKDPRIDRSPLYRIDLHQLPIQQAEDVPLHLQGKTVAVSTTLLFGSYSLHANDAYQSSVEFLRRRQPTARTTTFLIYDFRGGPNSTAARIQVKNNTPAPFTRSG